MGSSWRGALGEEIPGLKVLFITGFAADCACMPNAPSLANETRILSKPFHLKDLVGEVDKILAAQLSQAALQSRVLSV